MDSEKLLASFVVSVLESQAKTLESLIKRDGITIEDVRILAAIYEVIDYNTVHSKETKDND